MFSLPSESDVEATNAPSSSSFCSSPASSRSGSHSPTAMLPADGSEAAGGSAATLSGASSAKALSGGGKPKSPSVAASSGGNPRKRRTNKPPRIDLESGAREGADGGLLGEAQPSTSATNGSSSEDELLPSSGSAGSGLAKSASGTNQSNGAEPHDKRMRLTSSSSSASMVSLLSVGSESSQTSSASADSACYDLADVECNGGQITPPSAKSAPLARHGTVIGDGEFELLTTGGQECKAIHVPSKAIYHCLAMKLDDYRTFMSVAERMEAAKNRLTGDELRELKRLLLPEETRVIAATHTSNLWYLITPDHQGSLHTHYTNEIQHAMRTGQSPWNERQSKAIFTQIVRLVAYCHQIGIYFGDFRLQKLVYTDKENNLIRVLHLKNIYVAPELEDDTIQKSGSKCCPAYIAPEVMSFNKPYSARAADSWSLGVVLYILLTGRFPFYAPKPPVLARLIRNCQYNFKTSDQASRSARMLVYSLLRPNPAERASAKQILMADWLRADQWDATSAGFTPAAKPSTLNVRVRVPENARHLAAANRDIPAALVEVLALPTAAARNTLYSTRASLRAEMERFVSNAQRELSEAESAEQLVPDVDASSAFSCGGGANVAAEEQPMCAERDALGIAVTHVPARA